MFILANVETWRANQKKKRENQRKFKERKKKYCFKVKDTKIQVCKKFFCGTLAISQKTIYNAFKMRNENANTPSRSGQGKHPKKRLTEVEVKYVKDHINSFPRVESHYCRADSTREYLDSTLKY